MQKQIKQILDVGESSYYTAREIAEFYYRKYYGIFLNRYEVEGMDYQQRDYMFRKFWADGRLACFKLEDTEGNKIGVFCPFAPSMYNIYDFPTKITLINKRGVRFIPRGLQEVDKDVVIGFAQRNHHSVKGMVAYYIQKIVNVEMIIRTNLKANKTPYIIPLSPEDKTQQKEIINQLERDDPFIFFESDNFERYRALTSGAPYIVDKLYSYKCALENELKEYLGVQNLGAQEKKEHLITSEVSINNEIIEEHKFNFIDSIKEFFDNIYKVLGIRYNIKERNTTVENPIVDEEEEEIENEI